MFERDPWRLGAVGAALVFGPAVVAAGGTVSQCRWDNSLECDGDDPECDYTETAACPDKDVVSMMGECIEHQSQYGRYSTRCEHARSGSAPRIVLKRVPPCRRCPQMTARATMLGGCLCWCCS